MELRGAIEALRMVEHIPGSVTLYTDSTYVIRGITQWIWGWLRRGWTTSEGKEVLNKDLWQELAQFANARTGANKITWKYVRGHTGIGGNERCDEIAVAFAKRIRIDLFDGHLSHYSLALRNAPPDATLPDSMGSSSKGKGSSKPHSYVSLIGTIPMVHATWAECERRVKGQAGAKFKKAQSAEDERGILKSWGIDPEKLKK
jgi:ribonuclease HI